MSIAAQCPKCQQTILLPARDDPGQAVLCPLCQTSFVAGTVVTHAVPGLPIAVPVDAAAPRVSAAVGPVLSSVEDLSTYGGAAPKSTARRRKPGETSLLGNLIAVVLGGVVGVSIGYCVLVRIGGLRYDFLEIADRLPVWVRPPAAAGANAHDSPAPKFSPQSESPPPTGAVPPASEVGGNADETTRSDAPLAAAAANDQLAGGEPREPATSDPPVELLGPRDYAPRTVAEMDAALSEVRDSLECPQCHGAGYLMRSVAGGVREVAGQSVDQRLERRVRCDVCGGRAAGRITPDVYQKLCGLAQVVTLVRVEPDRADIEAQRESLHQLFQLTGSSQVKLDAIGRMAGYKLESSQRKDPGIVIAGTIQEAAWEGKLYRIRLVLFGLPKPVTVLSWRSPQPELSKQDRVIILGTIVDNPRSNLSGYEGDQSVVVWGGLPVKLSAP